MPSSVTTTMQVKYENPRIRKENERRCLREMYDAVEELCLAGNGLHESFRSGQNKTIDGSTLSSAHVIEVDM